MKCLTLANKIEAMKNLMLHHIASLLYHFIASGAQIWLTLPLKRNSHCSDRKIVAI
jgi:hypothetical protein